MTGLVYGSPLAALIANMARRKKFYRMNRSGPASSRKPL
jgi:hypothetical protein